MNKFRINEIGVKHLKSLDMTDRQIEVIQTLIKYSTQKESAGSLFINVGSLKYHITNINRMLRTRSTKDIICKLIGYIEPAIEGIEAIMIEKPDQKFVNISPCKRFLPAGYIEER